MYVLLLQSTNIYSIFIDVFSYNLCVSVFIFFHDTILYYLSKFYITVLNYYIILFLITRSSVFSRRLKLFV